LKSRHGGIPPALLNRIAKIQPKFERQFCQVILERALVYEDLGQHKRARSELEKL